VRRTPLLVPLLAILALVLGTAASSAAPLPQAGPPDSVKVFVVFDRQPGPNEQALVRAAGGQIRFTYSIVPALSADLPQAAIQGLQNRPGVVLIEPVIDVYAIGTVQQELDNTWGVKKIGAGTAHAANPSNTGAAVHVAVIDSGIDYNHADLAGRYAGGRDFVNNDSDPMDDNGHGTHVAGTVGAIRDGNGVVGAAPEARLYGLKVLGASGGGSYDSVVAALNWIVTENAAGRTNIRITNNSYGSSGDPGTTVRNAFQASADAGILHIAAAGNNGNRTGTTDTVGYPARYPSVVAVAATDSSDKRASFSSTGPDVELAAPGVSVRSTTMGGGYAAWNGTSMASPHVAGAAALIIKSGKASTPSAVRTLLQNTAVDLGSSGRDSHFGFGRIDVAAALGLSGGAVSNTPPTVTITSPANGASFAAGATISFTGSASDTEDGSLTTSLSWKSDRDGAIGTGGSFSKVLTGGTHVITAEVTDSGGLKGSASVSITVQEAASSPPPPGGSTVSVSAITYATSGGRLNNNHLDITIALASGGAPVPNASVSATLTRNSSTYGTYSGTTGSNGTVTFRVNNHPSGSYSTAVTNVTVSGYEWDGVTPSNSHSK
jgi:subtilisin